MEKIPDLYDGINFNSLPKSIYDELITNSNDRGFTVTKNDKGEAITIDGEYLRPLFMYFSGDYNFYLNLKHYDYLERRLKDGNCFDKDYNKLDVKTIYPFYKYYNDGFLKGYNEFENSLKNNTSLFSITNEQIAFKIYSRVTRNGIIKENDGNFKLVNDSFSNKEIDEKICKEYGIKLTIKIYEENFFESGFNGGEFYKAWELILNNPTVFEPIFKANVKTETTSEPEPLDLSDTSAVEKIIVVKEPYGEMFTNNGFELFEYILNEYVKPKNTTGRYEDLSYYYRCLFEDKFIHQRPEPFREWFIEKYNEEFTKIKTKPQTTSPQRKKDYSSALDWFKHQNK